MSQTILWDNPSLLHGAAFWPRKRHSTGMSLSLGGLAINAFWKRRKDSLAINAFWGRMVCGVEKKTHSYKFLLPGHLLADFPTVSHSVSLGIARSLRNTAQFIQLPIRPGSGGLSLHSGLSPTECTVSRGGGSGLREHQSSCVWTCK